MAVVKYFKIKMFCKNIGIVCNAVVKKIKETLTKMVKKKVGRYVQTKSL